MLNILIELAKAHPVPIVAFLAIIGLLITNANAKKPFMGTLVLIGYIVCMASIMLVAIIALIG